MLELTTTEELDIALFEDVVLVLGPDQALEHFSELIQDVNGILDRDDRYDFEIEDLEQERADLARKVARLRIRTAGAPNQRHDELTLNELAQERGWTLTQAQVAFSRGEVIAHRWAVIGGKPYPRFYLENNEQ